MAQPKNSKKSLFSWTGHIRARRPRRLPAHIFRRRRINAVILLFFIAFIVGSFQYYTADERIKQQAMKALSNITGCEVDIDSASLEALGVIRIKDLKLYPPNMPHDLNNILFSADDVLLEHRSTSIIRQQLILRRIVANGATLHVRYQPDINWLNLRELNFQPRTSLGALPVVDLRNAALEYTEITDTRQSQVARQVVSGKLTPDPNDPYQYIIKFTSEPTGIVSQGRLDGSFNLKTHAFSSSASADLAMIDLSGLPQRAQQWQEIYHVSQPSGSVNSKTVYDPNGNGYLQLTLTDVALNIPIEGNYIPLQNVNASITITPEQVDIESMRGKFLDDPNFSVAGQIYGYSTEAPLSLEITANNLNIPQQQWEPNNAVSAQSEIPGLNHLLDIIPSQTARIIRICKPTGRVSLRLNLRRSAEPGSHIEISGDVDCLDINVNYEYFQYPLSGIAGPIAFTPDTVSLGPLETTQQQQRVTIHGNMQKQQDHFDYDIYVDAENATIDEKLYHALSQSQRQLWRRFNPQGTVNAQFRQSSHNGQWREQNLDIQLLNVRILPEDIPIEMTNIYGSITRHPDEHIDFRFDHAEALQGTAEITGRIDDIEQEQFNWNCQIDFDDIIIDEHLHEKLPGELAGLVEKTGYQGRASGRMSLRRGETNSQDPNASLAEKLSLELNSQLYDGTLLHQDFDYELTNVQADIELSAEQLTISRLQATHNNSEISAHGQMYLGDGYQLHVDAANLPVDDQLRQMLGPQTESFWQKFNPSGTISLRADIQSQPGQADYYKAEIEWLSGRLRPAEIEYIFDNIQGQITVEPDQIQIHQLTSQNGQTRMNLSGNITPQAGFSQEDQYAYLLQLNIASLTLDETTRPAMPQDIRQLLEQLEINGLANIDMQIRHRIQANSSGNWNFNGTVSLQEGQAALPMPVENTIGRLEGQAYYSPDENVFRLNGRLNAENITIENKDITNLTADIDYDGINRQLAINHIVGDFCQGRVGGDISARFVNDQISYQLALQLLELDLAQYLQSPQAPRQSVEGVLNGTIALNSQGPIQTRQGSFSFAATEATLGSLPQLAQILSVLDLSLPQDDAFRQAYIEGSVIGENTNFDNIQLRSDSLNLTGKGRMTYPDNQLAIAFAVDAPEFIANVPILGSFVHSFVNPSLVKVRVTGDFNSPVVESVAFPSFDAALHEIESNRR